MRKSKGCRYSYTILLGISFMIAAVFLGYSRWDSISAMVIDRIYPEPEENSAGITGTEESADIEKTETAVITESPESSVPKEESTLEEECSTETTITPVIYHADVSYFDDALFIGDSRTVGLYEYGGLGNAEVFAHSGMNIYKIFKEEFALRSGEKVTLEEALQKRSFGKIYIMLGINELGYSFEQTVERFEEAVAQLQKLQPDAIIFIQANLHISKEKSEESDIFTNENINKYNDAIHQLADGEKIIYLDANPLYDDEDGALSTEFSSDHAHILGKYYVDWVDYILQNAVRTEEK